MKQVLIQGGRAIVSDVPAPQVSAKNILVRVSHSCISVGTEMASLNVSGLPLYRRALKQPENVKRLVDMMRAQGIKRTFDRVTGTLAAGSPTGYSASGVVIDVGAEVEAFSIGDRVACSGAGIANHAEVIDVPVNLAVKVPEKVSTEDASTVTLGAIAMQGVRRVRPTLGETIVVVGLGILGQMTAQILAANGCRVLGVDLDAARIRVALDNGMDTGLDPNTENHVERVLKHTDGFGADAVIITAATSSDQLISEAFQSCRKKGRVVLVGDVGLNLKRADFYKKEIDFLISSSYGPGRYDPVYEEGGQDYPLPFVRWTENRNMQSYLDLIASGKVRLESLRCAPFEVERAGDAYEALKSETNKPLLTLLSYPTMSPLSRRVEMRVEPAKGGKINVALVGASSFAQGMHLPNMVSLRRDYALRAVVSRTGSTARAVSTQYQAAYCTTDYEEVLADKDVNLIMVATRHDLHGSLVLKALQAGKNVFVEKPLTLDETDLGAIEKFYAENPRGPVLMCGFNRRFAPAIQHVRDVLKGRTTPMVVNYRMNAGFIPRDHWVHGPEGGGRNLGEACHIYDLFTSLANSREVVVAAQSINPMSKQWSRNDNFVATVKFEDGSVCALTYTALGEKSYPKERMEIFTDGKVIVMDDYKAVEIHGGKHKGWSAKETQKGQLQELESLAETLLRGKPWPISLEQQLQATRISFEVEHQLTPSSQRN